MDRTNQHPYGEKQPDFDRRYLEMAQIWAQNSYCERRQVGALIVKDKRISPMGIMAHQAVLRISVRTKLDAQNLTFFMPKPMP
jgi:deoxycytidylate deaminase